MAVGRGLGSGSEELSAQSQATCAYAIIKVIDVSKIEKQKKNTAFSFIMKMPIATELFDLQYLFIFFLE